MCTDWYFAYCFIHIEKRSSSLNLHSNAATVIFSVFCKFNKRINAYIIFLHYFVKIALVFISNGSKKIDTLFSNSDFFIIYGHNAHSPNIAPRNCFVITMYIRNKVTTLSYCHY